MSDTPGGSLNGKVALVTGGSRGIGAAAAHALATDGASVAISYSTSADAANRVVSDLTSAGVRAIAYQADQADPSQVSDLVAAVAADLGRLDILVNNAATYVISRVDDAGADQAALDRQLTVNLRAVTVAIRAAARLLTDQGRIITIGSMQALRPGFTGVADYTCTKAAIIGYSKGAARDLGPRGITVNVIQPGSTATDMNPPDSPFADIQRQANALGRFGTPEEIAAGIRFLASPEASFITGAVLTIDGGYLA